MLGDDIVFPVQYFRFPDDRYESSDASLYRVHMTHPGGHGIWSFFDNNFISRLDYIFVSEALATTHPVGEIYYSRMDGPFPGLPKPGVPLPATTSLASSDHLPVFVDLYLPTAMGPTGTENHTEFESTARINQPQAPSPPHSPDSAFARTSSEPSAAAVLDGNGHKIMALTDLSRETPLTIRPHADGGVELIFFARNGFLYTLESTEQIAAAPEWTIISGTNAMVGRNTWLSVLDQTPGAPGHIRAYRLRMQEAQ